MNILLNLFILSSESSFCFGTMGEKHPPDSLGNFADKNSYVVGIPLSPSTLYVDHPSDNRSNIPPSDLGLRKRSGTSFQITSVTVQGSRLNNEDCEDSADDYDDSHTDDISSDILDSSRFTEQDGSQSEDNTNANSDDLSPCGPLIITPLPSTTNNNNTINVGLGIDMSPPFPAIGPSMVSSGVTMMTSSKESPVSAQVHPLPDNWQHRFKVVKIVSSEPFRRGRWLCMDFRDPPPPPGNNNVGGNINRNAMPSIQVTPSSQDVCPAIRNCQGDEQLTNANRSVAHVYEIPVSAAYATDVGTQHSQPLYGIFVPQNNINNNNVVNEISIVHQVPTSSMAPNQNAMQGTTYTSGAVPLPQNYPLVSQNAFRQAAAAPQQPVLDANANKVVPGYGAMNGHDQNAANFGYTGGGRQVPDIRPVAPPPVADKAPPRNSHMDSAESAASSGASTVAIDNKIEQAMDLVKSHLMFAVREEVEVLKEKITELLERISQLEHENDILRANASPETLKQLNQSQKKFTSHSVIGKQQNVVSPHVQNQPPPS